MNVDHDHVEDQDVQQAHVEPVPVDYHEEPSLLPTRKWLAGVVTSLGGVATMWATTGSWDQEETVALITLIVGSAVAYLLPNQPTPGGVPEK